MTEKCIAFLAMCDSCPFLFSYGKVDRFDDHFGMVKSCDFVFPIQYTCSALSRNLRFL